MSRNSGDKFTLLNAFLCAGHGIVYVLKTQRNFKIHCVFFVLAICLALLFDVSQAAWLAIILCSMMVMSLEILNTSLEAIVDLISPEWHELARIAKDCAAGAVFLAAIGSVVVAAIIFIPSIIAYIPQPL